MQIRIVFAAVVYVSVLHANAQDFTVAGESYHLIEKKDGFENARCLIQDHNGFFWIGTTEGVLRYNGHELDKLEDLLTHEPPALRDITALHLDKTGNIWIGARGKVDRLSISSMTLDEVRMVSGDSAISRLPEINDLHFVDNNRLLITTYQGLYILTRRNNGDSIWNVSHYNQLNLTANESRFLDSLQTSCPLASSLIIRDSLRHSVRFSVKDSSDFLIVSTSPKMFSGIDENNDMAWIENRSGEKIWSKYDEFYFLGFHPTVVRLPPGKYTLYGHLKLYDYSSDFLPKYEVLIYGIDQESARLFRSMRVDWRNRRSIVEDNTGEMLADEQGTVWITGGGGLTSLKFVEGEPVFNVYTPHEGKEFGQHGIHTFTIKPSRATGFWLLGRGYSRLAQLRQGKAIFGQNHLMFYEAERQRFTRMSYDGTDPIADIAEDADSSLWVLYENGILNRLMFHKSTRDGPQQVDQVNLSSFGRADKLLIDRSGNLWVLTGKQGLIKVTRSKNQIASWSWPRDQVLVGKSANLFDEFLLFTGDGSVFRPRISGKDLDARMVGTLEHPVIDFLRLSDTSAIAATRHGRIYFLNKYLHSDKSIGIDSLHFNPRVPVGAIRLVSVSDDWVYLCTNQGLFSINVPEKKISTNLFGPQPQSLPMISDVYSFHGKHLAVVNMNAGSQGIHGFIVPVEASARKKGFIYREYADLGIEINAVVQWSDRILVGSERGVHEYIPEKDTFLLLTPSGYPSVYNMIADDRGFIWTIGREGVTCFDVESRRFYTVAKLPLPEKKFDELSPALWQIDMEHILFIVNNRLYKLLIDSAHVQENKPLIHFDNIGLQNSPGENRRVNPIQNTVVLSPGQNTFTVDFAATDLAFPERAYFSYRLIGYHEDWINTTHSEIQFINVPHGDYTLELRVVDGLRTSSTSMSLRLEPLWWQTIVARVFFGAVLLFITWWAWRTIIQRERLKSNLKLEQMEREREHIQLEKAQEIDKAKTAFLTNISHEFRTPLTLIKGPTQNLLEEFSNKPKVREQLEVVQHNADLLLKLINQLLDLAKLETGNLLIKNTDGDLTSFLDAIVHSFASAASYKGIDLIIKQPDIRCHARFDKDKLEVIVINLIGNALKFTPAHGQVGFSADIEKNSSPGEVRLIITVSDDGIGIPADQQTKIFERFYQVDQGGAHTELGTGIGLALVKELTELMGGQVTLKSELTKGSEFRVVMPLQIIKVLEQIENLPHPEKTAAVPIDTFTMAAENGEAPEKPRILVVEDNADLRKFIIVSLGDDYDFLEADNGKLGLDVALMEIPELIVSDLMMPEMDGLTMTAKIKKDFRTSHVPVIILTAKATEEDKLTGLKTGGDDYLTKPFNKSELVIKVRNAITSRVKIREKIRLELLTEAPKLEAVSEDEKFLVSVKEAILNRLADEQLSVESLAMEIGWSRAQFYRKITALTGKSVNDLIQGFRLQKAAQLLGQQWGSVSQVAYEVGFSNPSYFSKCFKEHYGVLPSEYRLDTV